MPAPSSPLRRGGPRPPPRVPRRDLLGASRAGVRGPVGPRPDRRPGTGGARREPYRQDVHRGLVRDVARASHARGRPREPVRFRHARRRSRPPRRVRHRGLPLRPAGKPALSQEELAACAPFLEREIELLDEVRVVLALGRIAWDAVIRRARLLGAVPRPLPAFAHGAETRVTLRRGKSPVTLLGSYHPSRQNTQTGRLTTEMFGSIILRAARAARELS